MTNTQHTHGSKTMTQTKLTIRHADTDIPGIFAGLTDSAFAGVVSILPNYAVLNSARRQSRRRDVEITVEADEPGMWTVYQIGRDYIFIDAESNQWNDLGELADDADDAAGFAELYPALADLIDRLAV